MLSSEMDMDMDMSRTGAAGDGAPGEGGWRRCGIRSGRVGGRGPRRGRSEHGGICSPCVALEIEPARSSMLVAAFGG
jgi:hypothetical protein